MNGKRKSIHPALLPVYTPEEAARLLLCAKGGVFVATLNFELIARGIADPGFAALLRSADYHICDGIGGAILLRRGRPNSIVPRIPGIDLGYALLTLATKRETSVFLLGGRPGVAKRAAKQLMSSLPGLQIAGTAHGFFSKTDLPALRGRIRASGAEIVIVCLGSPQQEEWIAANRRYLPSARLFLPLGGSLDVWAGEVSRAPYLWQAAGIEWLWRILHAPGRIGRLWVAGCALLRSSDADLYPKKHNFVSN
ncbi:MAG: WecB/TagA/CpsF family glycosyltransferase [Clostridia bacterium]|nr:WecB/TagA/CpsF family glycosyltransferase [Clostridia bacterium]